MMRMENIAFEEARARIADSSYGALARSSEKLGHAVFVLLGQVFRRSME